MRRSSFRVLIPGLYHGSAQSREIRALLGLAEGEGLPREGMGSTMIQGVIRHGAERDITVPVKVWVTPLPERTPDEAKRQGKRSTHRVLCQCPVCGHVLSVGRLAQHECKPKDIMAMAERNADI